MTIVVYHREADRLAEVIRCRTGAEAIACVDLAAVTEAMPLATFLLTAGYPHPPFELGTAMQWVQTGSAGVDRVLPLLPAKTILSRGYGLHDVTMSEHCLGRILAHELNLRQAWINQSARKWERYPTGRVAGKILGICGMGTIGSALARRARAFDMRVWGLRRKARSSRYVERMFGQDGLLEFLAGVDYLVILLPLTEATRGMFGKREFLAMKPGSVLISMGRGPVVRERELIECLREGLPAAALLDVFDQEPLPPESELWGLPNVTITPHNAGGLSEPALLDLFLTNLERVRAGRKPLGYVRRRLGY